MNTDFSEILDNALEQLQKNNLISEILKTYSDQAEYLDPLLTTVETLQNLRPIELPSEEDMQMDRIEFLAGIESAEIPSVSMGLLTRIKEQMRNVIHRTEFVNPYVRKEKTRMNMVARVMLAIALFLGLSGGAYAMTENSLPTSLLYEAKLAMEQAQLQMQSDPAGAANQHLIMAMHRSQEILGLLQAGKEPDEGWMTKLENHLNTAFQLSAQLGDREMLGVLTQAMNMLQEQNQQMTQIQLHLSDTSQAQLQLMIQLLNQAQNQAELGLQDPEAFRFQFRNGPYAEQSGPSGPNGDQGCPNCPCVDCEPQGEIYQNQNQNGTQSEPSVVTDGDQDCPNCPCADCDGVPDQDRTQTQAQDQSWDGTTPGGPNGNQDCPNCPCTDCDSVPDQDQTQDQIQDQTQDQTQDQGCPICPCTDCDGVPDKDQTQPQNQDQSYDGSQNQNGSGPG